jgi:hypothetical protein
MATSLDDPEFWKARAEEARLLAEQVTDYNSKAVLFRIAVDYERIADRTTTLRKN